MERFKNKELNRYIALINYIFILILILLNIDKFFGFAKKIIDIFNPVLIAIVLAFVINIPMKNIEEKLKNNIDEKNPLFKHIRLFSYLLATIFVLTIIIIIINLVVPELVSSIKALIQNISNRSQIIDFKLILDNLGIDGMNNIDINKFLESSGLTVNSLTERLSKVLTSITGGALIFITSAGGTLMDWLIGSFISIYFLLKKEETLERLNNFMIAVLPYNIQRVSFQYLKTYYRIFEMFVSKRILESAILGFIEYLGCIIFGIPYAILIAVMTFVLSIIPYFGCLIALIIGWILIAPVNFGKSIIFIIVFEIITIFESNVIYPKVVGKSLGLPEAWTLISLILFGELWGFVGMLIAVPIAGCIYVSLTDFVNYRKKIVREKEIEIEKSLDDDIAKIRKKKISK